MAEIDHKAIWGAGFHAGRKAAEAEYAPWVEVHRSGTWSYQKKGSIAIIQTDKPYEWWTRTIVGSEQFSLARHIASKAWPELVLSDFLEVWLFALADQGAMQKFKWMTPDWLSEEIDRAKRDFARD